MDDQKVSNQGMRTLFIEAVHSAVRLEFLTTDSFVINKAKVFTGEIINLLSEYEIAAFKTGTKEQSVAQYNGLSKDGLERVLLGLEYIQHFNAVPAAPLLVAIHSVLKLKSELFSEKENNNVEKRSGVNQRIDRGVKNKIENLRQKDPGLLSENKKKILEFISQSLSVRPREVLVQFNYLTKRTVKRNLQELFEAGLLLKENQDKAVLYTVAKK